MPSRSRIDDYSGPTVTGIDVSKWQGPIDWNAVVNDPQRVTFAIVRAGDGLHLDSRAVENLTGADRAGLATGAYHYFRGAESGAAQAELAHSAIAQSRVRPFAVFIDLEAGGAENATTEQVMTQANAFITTLERRGYRVGVYGGQWIHWALSQAQPELASALKSHVYWVPSYRPGAPLMPINSAGVGYPWAKWSIHQYAANGSVSGIHGNVDMNRFRGNLATFRAWSLWGKAAGSILGPLRSHWLLALIAVAVAALLVAWSV